MSPQRLHDRNDRYRAKVLQPDGKDHHAEIIALIGENGVHGTVFHVLEHVPEQGEDMYTVLVDDKSVVTFEVPRGTPKQIAEEFYSSPVTEYRNEIGQGKCRSQLDKAIENARKLLRT